MAARFSLQDAPGEMTCHYRDDGTTRYTVATNDTCPYCKKWKVDVIDQGEFIKQIESQLGCVQRSVTHHDG